MKTIHENTLSSLCEYERYKKKNGVHFTPYCKNDIMNMYMLAFELLKTHNDG